MKKALSVVLGAALLFTTACSASNETTESLAPETEATTAATTSETTAETTEETTEATEQTESSRVVEYYWFDGEIPYFEEFCEGKLGRFSLRQYVYYFGFTDYLNSIFTYYMNYKFDMFVDTVPFSEADYFYIIYADDSNNLNVSDHLLTNRYKDYDKFVDGFLEGGTYADSDDTYVGIFENKLVLSYLVQNEIPFGTVIPFEYFESLVGDVLNYDARAILIEETESRNLGNPTREEKYTDYDLEFMLERYNYNVIHLCLDQRVKSTVFSEYPEKEALFNGYLKQYFGNNAPQIGQVITKEQYRSLFGEDPIDLSHIPGAVPVFEEG